MTDEFVFSIGDGSDEANCTVHPNVPTEIEPVDKCSLETWLDDWVDEDCRKPLKLI